MRRACRQSLHKPGRVWVVEVLVGGITPALRAVRKAYADTDINVEVSNIQELEQALADKAPRILLDNFAPGQVREAMHAIREVLTGLEQRYFDTETVFIGSITQPGALDLLNVLYFGIREQAKADGRIRCRKATEEDYPALALTDET